MKKAISLLMCAIMILANFQTAYAANSTPAKIPTEILNVINKLNFSSETNDRSKELTKWITQSSLSEEDTLLLLGVNEGLMPSAAYLTQPTKLYSYREIIKPWAAVGKADKTLGQRYESTVYLLVGQTKWEYLLIKTSLWVKKNGNKYVVTKLDYVGSEYEKPEKAIKFYDANKLKIYQANLLNLENYYQVVMNESKETLSTESGIEITSLQDQLWFYDSQLMMTGKVADINNGKWIQLTRITVKENTLLDLDLEYYGFDVEKTDLTVRIIDDATGMELEYNDGYNLEPGKTYIQELSVTGSIILNGNGKFYFSGNFYE